MWLSRTVGLKRLCTAGLNSEREREREVVQCGEMMIDSSSDDMVGSCAWIFSEADYTGRKKGARILFLCTQDAEIGRAHV